MKKDRDLIKKMEREARIMELVLTTAAIVCLLTLFFSLFGCSTAQLPELRNAAVQPVCWVWCHITITSEDIDNSGEGAVTGGAITTVEKGQNESTAPST